MREYEITIILKGQLDEAVRSETLERVQSWLEPDAENGETKMKVDHWGLRQLAYPINKITEGYYVYYEGLVDPERIKEIERNFLYNEDIIRYLVIRKES